MSDSADVVARARHRRTDRDEVPAQDGRDLEVEPGVGVLAAIEAVAMSPAQVGNQGAVRW